MLQFAPVETGAKGICYGMSGTGNRLSVLARVQLHEQHHQQNDDSQYQQAEQNDNDYRGDVFAFLLTL